LDRRDSGKACPDAGTIRPNREKETPMGPVVTILVVILVIAAVVWFLRRA
jgi:hypothetical protein